MTATKARKKGAPVAPKAQEAQGMSSLDKMVETDKIENGQSPSVNGNGSGSFTPKPVPGEKEFDWQAEYPGEKVFVYTVPKGTLDARGNDIGGVTVGFAAISEKRQPSIGFLRAVRHKREFDQVVDMIEMVASDAALSVIDPWRATCLQDAFEQWNEWQETTAGKP